MKGEYHHHHHQLDPKPADPSAAAAMFSKLHHPFSHHHFHLAPGSDQAHPSEDDSSAATSAPSRLKPAPAASSADGASIEVVRRPRGRPPGSKNKPKPPVVITRDPDPVMSPYILEVPGGADVVDSISRFCRRKGTGLCILTGSGTVANFTLRQPAAANSPPGATVTFHGRFEILSISATFLHQTPSYSIPNGFSISLAGPQGQIVGGYVAGPLVAAGPVFVVAASFNNPSYHRLPDDGEDSRKSASDGHSPPVSAGTDSGKGAQSHSHSHQQQQQGGGDSCGGVPAMYSCHMPTDTMWAPPPSKQQQQQQHHY